MSPTATAPPRDLALVTVAGRKFLPFARLLARSIARHHPGTPFYLVLTDAPPDGFAPEHEPEFHLRPPEGPREIKATELQ